MANSDAMHAYLLSGQALRLAVMLGLHLLDETYDESLIRPVRHAFPTLLPIPTSYDELDGPPPSSDLPPPPNSHSTPHIILLLLFPELLGCPRVLR